MPRKKRKDQAAPSNGDGAQLVPEQSLEPIKRYHASLAEFTEAPCAYLWDGRVLLPGVTVVSGASEVGKSTVLTQLAAVVSTGGEMPGGPRIEPGNVLVYSSEELVGYTFRGRFQALGGDMTRVFVGEHGVDGKPLPRLRLPKDAATLEDYVRDQRVRLILIDKMKDFIDAGANPDHLQSALGVYGALTPICMRYRASAVIVLHPRKANGHGGPKDQVAGTSEWTNAARTVLQFGAHPHFEGLFCAASMKCSLGPKPPTLTYRIVAKEGFGVPAWEGVCDLTAEQLAAAAHDVEARDLFQEGRALARLHVGTSGEKSTLLKRLGEDHGIPWKLFKLALRAEGCWPTTVGPNDKRYRAWKAPEGGFGEERVPDGQAEQERARQGTEMNAPGRKA
jgi:hypothetical protein